MRQYIINLTNNLIGKNHYDSVFHRIASNNEFVQHVRTDLFCGDVQDMSPETLGKIMCSFEIGDVMASKNDLFSNITFVGDCEDMLRELVSLCLAYVIRDRLDNTCLAGTSRWERRRSRNDINDCPRRSSGPSCYHDDF